MLTVYIVTAVLGGLLVLASAIFGHADTSTEVHFDAHLGDHEMGHGADSDHAMDSDHAVWSHVFSIRFLTYLSATFGVLGILLTSFSTAKEPLIATVSLLTGLASATGIVLTFGLIRTRESNSSSRLMELIGRPAKVLVPVRKEQAGKVRCEIKGEFLDLLALNEGEEVLAQGSEVLIVNVEGDRVIVSPQEVVFGRMENNH